jgi:endonuclease/exonuclease/phosphatase family metal-dependent hydrolase
LASLAITNGMAIFLRKDLEGENTGRLNLYYNHSGDNGFAQYILVKKNGKKLHILSVHGKTHPGHKFDTAVRVKQSERIIEFMKDKEGAKIIGGDFNLMPYTKSIDIIEKAGYRNLIKEFKIKSTRNRISWEQFKDRPGFIKQFFADYVFTSEEIKVNAFRVPDVEISDHLPLILDFDF